MRFIYTGSASNSDANSHIPNIRQAAYMSVTIRSYPKSESFVKMRVCT